MSRRSSTASTERGGAAGGGRRRRRRAGASAGGRLLHVDASAGMAGNMFMAALLDAGLDRRALEAGLSVLPLDFKLKIAQVARGGFAARYVDVVVPGRKRIGRPRSRAKTAHAGHDHAHEAHDPHEAHEVHEAQGVWDEHHVSHGPHGRSHAEIVRLLEKSALAEPVRRRALGIFDALARAEAHVHGQTLEDVHFHEVGMIDAIVDATAAALGLELMGIERVTCSPVGIGHGFVSTAHGRLPIPTPATLVLLEGIPTAPLDVAWETITPTGAAILRTLVDEFVSWPAMTVESVGCGAGRERPGALPNLVRALVGRGAGAQSRDRVAVIETNLDDLVPEHFEHLLERLLEAGALDVSIQHLVTKKNRPGFLLRVLCPPTHRDIVARTLFAESTAIGLRHQEWDRLVLERRIVPVATAFGRIRVKEVVGPDGDLSFSAEYDDCKQAARRRGVALRTVVEAAEAAARESAASAKTSAAKAKRAVAAKKKTKKTRTTKKAAPKKKTSAAKTTGSAKRKTGPSAKPKTGPKASTRRKATRGKGPA